MLSPLLLPCIFFQIPWNTFNVTPLTMVPVSYHDCQSQQVQANKIVIKRKQTSDAVLARAAAASIRTRQNTFKSFKQSAFNSHVWHSNFPATKFNMIFSSHSFLLIVLLVNGTGLQKIYRWSPLTKEITNPQEPLFYFTFENYKTIVRRSKSCNVRNDFSTLGSTRQLLRAFTKANDVREWARNAATACTWPITSLSFSSWFICGPKA